MCTCQRTNWMGLTIISTKVSYRFHFSAEFPQWIWERTTPSRSTQIVTLHFFLSLSICSPLCLLSHSHRGETGKVCVLVFPLYDFALLPKPPSSLPSSILCIRFTRVEITSRWKSFIFLVSNASREGAKNSRDRSHKVWNRIFFSCQGILFFVFFHLKQ